MPPIDLPPIRPTCSADPRPCKPATPCAEDKAKAETAAPSVEIDTTLGAAEPPVEQGRIDEIRKAIEQGRYPVIPMRVADALIASGLLLRSGK